MTPELALSILGLFLCCYGLWLVLEMQKAQKQPVIHIHFRTPKQDRWTLEQAIQHVKSRDAKKQKRDSKGRFA